LALAAKPQSENGKTIPLAEDERPVPNTTGVELAAQLQLERPHLHVLPMSGMAVPLNERWHFLPKPVMTRRTAERGGS
jgi:hypothetical protein